MEKQKTTRELLIERIEEHLSEKGLTATEFGKQAMSDPNFVFDLRDGRNPQIGTLDRVNEYISGAGEAAQA